MGIKSAHNWTEEDVETIMSNLRFDDDHVIERANVMLMYRAIKNKVKEGLLSYSKKNTRRCFNVFYIKR